MQKSHFQPEVLLHHFLRYLQAIKKMPESKSVVLLRANNKSFLVFGQLRAFNVKQLQEEVISLHQR